MTRAKGRITIDKERCKGCSLCIVACPTETIALSQHEVNSRGYAYAETVAAENCIGCAACGMVCPDACIEVFRKSASPAASQQKAATIDKSIETFSDSAPLPFYTSQTDDAEPQEPLLLKGNEALAHAAVRCGCDGYFGYPITPQSEVLETLAELRPWETTGMVVVQAESEVASINMLYGGGGTGKRVMTSSSSVGIALMQEGIAYMAGAEVPGLIVNVQRGGPGLGTIQPSQSDYMQATRGGGNGDYQLIVLAPNSVQEMADFVDLGFTLAFRYRNPVMILSDGIIGQMMERVVLPPYKPRRTDEQILQECPWASNGLGFTSRRPQVVSSLELDPAEMERKNHGLQAKYELIRKQEVRYEATECDDAEWLLVAFGSASRISQKVVDIARGQGQRLGLFRPITLWPFPEEELRELSRRVKGILCVEINAGQMVWDVRMAAGERIPVEQYGRLGGIVPTPDEILQALSRLQQKATPH